MKILVYIEARLGAEIEIPDGLEGDALTDAISDASPGLEGWENADVDVERYSIIKEDGSYVPLNPEDEDEDVG